MGFYHFRPSVIKLKPHPNCKICDPSEIISHIYLATHEIYLTHLRNFKNVKCEQYSERLPNFRNVRP